MDSPSVRHVVKDRSSAASMVDPRDDRNRLLGVNATVIWEFDVAVSSAKKFV